MAMLESDRAVPKAFISYSWDDGAHKEWVKQLATRLRADGIDVTLDRWHAALGDQIPAFMERAVRENDFVIAICTPRFKQKADGRGGGVGYEGDIMTAFAFASGAEKKFIPALRRGTWVEAAPTWLLGRAKIDLSGDPYSESEYEELLRTLHGEREVAPPIGERPTFGTTKMWQAGQSPAPVPWPAGSSTPQYPSPITPRPDRVQMVTNPSGRSGVRDEVASNEYAPFTKSELLQLLRKATETLRDLKMSVGEYTDATMPLHRRIEMRAVQEKIDLINRELASRA
jgi:TIR domain